MDCLFANWRVIRCVSYRSCRSYRTSDTHIPTTKTIKRVWERWWMQRHFLERRLWRVPDLPEPWDYGQDSVTKRESGKKKGKKKEMRVFELVREHIISRRSKNWIYRNEETFVWDVPIVCNGHTKEQKIWVATREIQRAKSVTRCNANRTTVVWPDGGTHLINTVFPTVRSS